MEIVAEDGTRLHVVIEGPQDGVPVVLSHQLGGTHECFDAQIAMLSGRRIIRFDTRGHGASGAPDGAYSVDILGRDVLSILDGLSIQSADFLGVSQGGMTGMWLAATHASRVRRLVLANTTAYVPNKTVWDQLASRAREEGMSQIARDTITSWVSEVTRTAQADLVERLIKMMAAMPVAGYVGNIAVLRDVDLRTALGSITAPTLVIGGTEDGPRAASVPILTEGVRDGRSVMVPRAAHLANLENPADFNAAVAAHLSN